MRSLSDRPSVSQAKGFEMTYLEKVPEVKDTVHKQSLLHHACAVVVENFPQSTDLYSEIGAITRSAKVYFIFFFFKKEEIKVRILD